LVGHGFHKTEVEIKLDDPPFVFPLKRLRFPLAVFLFAENSEVYVIIYA